MPDPVVLPTPDRTLTGSPAHAGMPLGHERPRISFPDLDGLRALAALAVIFYHCSLWFDYPDAQWSRALQRLLSFAGNGGRLGVTFFFVLSGFLITYLMLDERRRKGRFSIGHFYMRRVLRIWPLYFLALIIGLWLCPSYTFAGHTDGAQISLPMHFAFLANYDDLLNGPPACGMLGVLWSVCVEEQFYVVWPLVFLACRRPAHLLVVMIGIGVLASWHYIAFDAPLTRYYHLLPNMRYLVSGALIAFLTFHRGERITAWLGRVPYWLHTLAYATGAGTLFLSGTMQPGILLDLIQFAGPSVFFAYVILHQTHGPAGPLHARRFPWLGHLGKVSYGIYLIHMVPVQLLGDRLEGPYAFAYAIPLVLAITILASVLSYRYFESPFLRLKQRWS